MFIHDVTKIKYIEEGYLPNIPYYLISDTEMLNAFIGPDGSGYFADNYPLLDEELSDEYTLLITELRDKLTDAIAADKMAPSWVYSYMLGSATSVNSNKQDILYLSQLSNYENKNSEFNAELSNICLDTSKEWIRKLPEVRPASMFGESHVIKSLRLKDVNVLN